MIGKLILTHGGLARELLSAAQTISGRLSNFEAVSLDWNDGLVLKLAKASYEERLLPSGQLDPDRLAVLADALLDAGCTDEDLLCHLRSEGPHHRGCWGVDLILGRG